MPRANRHFLPGLVWHIIHRCHRREFLLKFARAHRDWVESALAEHQLMRQAHRSESIAVGSERFTQEVKTHLGVTARYRAVAPADERYALR